MASRTLKTLLVVTVVVVFGGILFSRSGALHPGAAQPAVTSASPAGDNRELTRLYDEDQSDRTPEENIDWKVVGPRDKARERGQSSFIPATCYRPARTIITLQ